MNRNKRLGRTWRLGIGLVLVGILTGCAGAGYYGYDGPGWYGPDYGDYGLDYYGGFWGPDGYVFRHHDHGIFGHDRDFGRRGSASRGAAGGFHGGFHGGGGFGHGGGSHGGGGGHGR